MSSLSVLNKTVCLMLRVSLWTGRRRLRAEDLGVTAQSLPPGDLASLGSLKLCNPKRLARLGAIKRAAERECARVCVNFLGGYATDEGNIAPLVASLQALEQRFMKEAQSFADGLQSEIDQWTALHPRWKGLIEKVLPDSKHVASRFQFSVQAFRVGAAAADALDPINAGLEQAAQGLSGQLFAEIEAEARAAWKSSFEGKAAVGQKALRPLRAILKKLEALRYLDARCQPIIRQFETVLASLPKHGPIEDPHLSAVIGLFRIAERGETLRAHGAALLRSTDAPPPDLFAEEIEDVDGANDSARPTLPVAPATRPTPAPPSQSERAALWI